jgi:hypothetical protein
MSSGRPLRFRDNAYLDIVSGAGGLVDCRRLFVGDHQRKLVRAYSEAVELLDRSRRNPQALESLRNSAEVNQYYDMMQGDEGVSLTLRDSIFLEPIQQFELDTRIEIN